MKDWTQLDWMVLTVKKGAKEPGQIQEGLLEVQTTSAPSPRNGEKKAKIR